MEITKFKNVTIEILKNYWILLNSKMDMTEDRISEIDDRTI